MCSSQKTPESRGSSLPKCAHSLKTQDQGGRNEATFTFCHVPTIIFSVAELAPFYRRGAAAGQMGRRSCPTRVGARCQGSGTPVVAVLLVVVMVVELLVVVMVVELMHKYTI